MKGLTKMVIFITLLSSTIILTIGFSIYVNNVIEKNKKNDHELYLKLYGELSSLEGYKYGVIYLYNRNLVREDTLVKWKIEDMIISNDKTPDSCTFEDYFFTSFKYCLLDAYKRGYLIKKDSTIVKQMLFDFDSIKTDYFKKIKE